ncbi:agmatine deiminase family protein [Streptomyces sp. MB09-01]|nr:agmatine deiminase family protein [Streptomyces sp. MB09-01]
MTRLFPDRVVERLKIDRLGVGGGGIHCVTQQQSVCRRPSVAGWRPRGRRPVTAP